MTLHIATPSQFNYNGQTYEHDTLQSIGTMQGDIRVRLGLITFGFEANSGSVICLYTHT